MRRVLGCVMATPAAAGVLVAAAGGLTAAQSKPRRKLLFLTRNVGA